MTSGDVNGDGYLDLITGAEWAGLGDLGGSITVHLGTGDGTFQPAVRYGIYPRGYYDVITADIDNDGHLDIVAAAQSGDYRPFHIPPTSVAVLYNHGDGTFGDPVFYDHAGVTIGKIAVADFNGDHLPDILTVECLRQHIQYHLRRTSPATRGSQHCRCGHCRQRRQSASTPGLAFTAVVGSFSDANPFSVSGDFTATIDWGDGQTSPGTVRVNPFGGFDVIGTHSYAVTGDYVTTITVAELGADTHQGTGTATLTDAAASLTAQGVDVVAFQFSPFAGMVATFQSDSAASAADFVAAIDWGDGQSSPGYIFLQPLGGFEVRGVHVYAGAGVFSVHVQINAVPGGSTIAQSIAAVDGLSAPLAHDDVYAVVRGGTLMAADATGNATPGDSADDGVLVNDTHGDGDMLTAILVTGPTHALSFTLNVDGSFSYVHDGSETTTDSFTYRVKDNLGAESNVATVSITVNAPPLASNDTATTNQNVGGGDQRAGQRQRFGRHA